MSDTTILKILNSFSSISKFRKNLKRILPYALGLKSPVVHMTEFFSRFGAYYKIKKMAQQKVKTFFKLIRHRFKKMKFLMLNKIDITIVISKKFEEHFIKTIKRYYKLSEKVENILLISSQIIY